MRTAVLLISLLAACEDKRPDPTSDVGKTPIKIEMKMKEQPKPTGTPRPQPALAVTLGGKPVDMRNALAWVQADGSLRLTASSVPVGCDEVTGNSRMLHDGEVTFDVNVGQQLQPDGTLAPRVTSTYYAGMTEQKVTPTTLTGDGATGQPTTVDLDFETHAAGKDGEVPLVVKGTIDALGCPAPKGVAAPPAPNPAMPATITIAGKELPIRFATIRKRDDSTTVRLFTGGEACKRLPSSRPNEYDVILTWNGPDFQQIQIGGTLVPSGMDGTSELRKRFRFTPTPTGAGEIEIKTDHAVVNKYPIEIAGKVTLTECPES